MIDAASEQAARNEVSAFTAAGASVASGEMTFS
jgi:hypothetical protein